MSAIAAASIDQRLANSYRADIENLVAQTALTEAFAKLQDFVRDLAPHLKPAALLLCSQYSRFSSEYRVGRVKWNESAPLIAGLLELLEEVHRCALVKPQFRLTGQVSQQTYTGSRLPEQENPPARADAETASNVTHLRPSASQRQQASEIENLDNLRRAYWRRYRDTQPPNHWIAFSCKNISRGY